MKENDFTVSSFETSHYFPININSVSNGIEEDYDIETITRSS